MGACRYPQPKGSTIAEPAGTRGAYPWIAAYLWGLTQEEYVERADVWPLNPKGEIFVVIIIEDIEGVRNIDEILSVKGLGAVFFGPYDYSFSCGRYGNMKHPDVLSAGETVRKACARHHVPLIVFADRTNIAERLKEGHKILSIATDWQDHGDVNAILDVIRKRK